MTVGNRGRKGEEKEGEKKGLIRGRGVFKIRHSVVGHIGGVAQLVRAEES